MMFKNNRKYDMFFFCFLLKETQIEETSQYERNVGIIPPETATRL